MIPSEGPRLIRADLHVHSIHSGFSGTLRVFRSRDSYSDPGAVYRRARGRGLDLVTITDHDSIDGCLELRARYPDAPDILIGEEIECRVPGSGLRVHLGAFGLTERHHRDVQPLRGSVFDAAAFLRSEGVALVLHHPFHFFRGETGARRYLEELLPLVHAVETRNATMVGAHNALAADVARAWNASGAGGRIGETGGSDAHVLGHVADTWTTVEMTPGPGDGGQAATPAQAFLDGLRAGRATAAGREGTTGRFAFEIYGVVFNYWGGLVGLRPSGLRVSQRLTGAAISLLSLPFQFTPLVVSLAQKQAERRRVAAFARALR
jgi:predicted metal-dependent phosphoesterase TrpH